MVNSTFTGNSTNRVGGALDLSYSDLVNDTIAGNSAVAGGVSDYQGSSLQNTIVAKNTASSGAPDAYSASGVPFTSRGNNLIGNADGSEGFANRHNRDQVGTASNPLDPKLQTDSGGNPLLQDNGGPTQTIALMPSSPAVDAGSDSVLGSPLNLATDQRGDGFPRKQGAHVDIGAFEAPADTAAPTVSITSGPADASTTNSSSAAFGFTVSDAGSGVQSVECGLDGDSFSPCDTQSSQSYSNLSDGRHTFTVRATDKAGNQGTASRTWTVDTTPPTVSSVVPANLATGVAPYANVSATFSEAMRATSINATTFRLYRAGTTTAVGAVVSYSSAAHKAVLNPTSNLSLGTRYKAVVTTGVRDLAGNRLAQSKVW